MPELRLPLSYLQRAHAQQAVKPRYQPCPPGRTIDNPSAARSSEINILQLWAPFRADGGNPFVSEEHGGCLSDLCPMCQPFRSRPPCRALGREGRRISSSLAVPGRRPRESLGSRSPPSLIGCREDFRPVLGLATEQWPSVRHSGLGGPVRRSPVFSLPSGRIRPARPSNPLEPAGGGSAGCSLDHAESTRVQSTGWIGQRGFRSARTSARPARIPDVHHGRTPPTPDPAPRKSACDDDCGEPNLQTLRRPQPPWRSS